MEKHSFEAWSPQLRNRRQVDVYLPDGYGNDRHPVVYLQDGQNLSDPSIAFLGNTWQLEESLTQLQSRGIRPIIVGVHNMGERRINEYTPFRDPRHGGGSGDRYLRFLINTVKPRIDAKYRTRSDRENTVIGGSSMGGLISLYAVVQKPSPFGHAIVMSPSIWFNNRAILGFVESAPVPRGRIYLDVGTAEGASTLRDTRALVRVLRSKGMGRSTLKYTEAEGHQHREADWASRLPAALEFVLRV